MVVTGATVKNYRERMSAINKAAAEAVQQYLAAHNFDIDDAFIDFAHSLTTLYGEAASALACQMYDELHEYWKATKGIQKRIYPAEPAPVPTRSQVEKSVYGTLKVSSEQIAGAVQRLVKQTAEDTTLKNAIRDGAEWAWIPAGDTCAFCIMLGSRGWQKQSKKAMKNGHAQHIHANCDCTYAVRFSSDMEVEGYDPEAYYRLYKDGANAPYINEDIDHPQPKQQSKRNLNGLRRMMSDDKKIGKYLQDITVD